MIDAEVRETLARHGMSAEDIAAVEAFEIQTRKRKARTKFVPESLDFGDWAL